MGEQSENHWNKNLLFCSLMVWCFYSVYSHISARVLLISKLIVPLQSSHKDESFGIKIITLGQCVNELYSNKINNIQCYQRDCSKCPCMTTQVCQYHYCEICLCSQFPCSYHNQECTHYRASCSSILVYCSQSGSCNLNTHSRCSGPRGSDVWSGTNPSSHSCHPQSLGWSSTADPFRSWIWRYMWRMWHFAAAEVGDNDATLHKTIMLEGI